MDQETTEGNVIEGERRNELEIINNLRDMTNGAHRAAREAAYEMRDALSLYFLTPAGEVSWQYEYIRRGQYHDVP